METPKITQDEYDKVEKHPLPIIIKLFIWASVGLCSTLGTVTGVLFYQNKDLYNRVVTCESSCAEKVMTAKELERSRTLEASRLCDSAKQKLEEKFEKLVSEKIALNKNEVNKLNKALK